MDVAPGAAARSAAGSRAAQRPFLAARRALPHGREFGDRDALGRRASRLQVGRVGPPLLAWPVRRGRTGAHETSTCRWTPASSAFAVRASSSRACVPHHHAAGHRQRGRARAHPDGAGRRAVRRRRRCCCTTSRCNPEPTGFWVLGAAADGPQRGVRPPARPPRSCCGSAAVSRTTRSRSAPAAGSRPSTWRRTRRRTSSCRRPPRCRRADAAGQSGFMPIGPGSGRRAIRRFLGVWVDIGAADSRLTVCRSPIFAANIAATS